MKAHGPKSMVSPESAVLSAFITPWTKPTCNPTRDQRGLALHDDLKQRIGGSFSMPGIGEVAIDYVIGQTFDGFIVGACREILKGSDADV